MNNRLTIQDLAGLLSVYTGKEKESLERFLREFIAVVSEGVYTDKIVKVKGLGTFKIVPVEKRESIHVNTGERFVIPAHTKFSFLPDKEMREIVNKPFSFFETTELGENVNFTDIDTTSDEPEMKEPEEESVEEITSEKEEVISEEKIIPEEKKEPEEEERPKIEEAMPEEEIMLEPEPEEVIYKKEENKRQPRMKRVAITFLFIFFLIIFNIVLYLNRNHFFEKEKEVAVLKEDTVSLEEDKSYLLTPDSVEITTEVKPEAAAPAPPPEVIARVKIEPGSRLTLISLKYYGSKLFWVYLYEHNKAVIKDPNNVPVGTVIEVPAPQLYGIDRRDRASIEKAAARQSEILSGRP